MYYAEFGNVSVEPKPIQDSSFVIGRDRYDELVQAEKSWYENGVYLTELSGEIEVTTSGEGDRQSSTKKRERVRPPSSSDRTGSIPKTCGISNGRT
jgi:hypothetical protein